MGYCPVRIFKAIKMEDFHLSEEFFLDNNESVIDDDEEEEVSNEYFEKSWPDKDPTGYLYKGKKRSFVNAVDTLKTFMKKGNRRTSENVNIRIIDSREIPNGIEREVEVVKDKEKGNAVVKFYGPNKKKGCTIIVNKTKNHDVKFALSLANEVVKPLLDSFISGESWKSLFKVPLSKTMQKALGKTRICDSCEKSFASDKTLAIHMNRYHGGVKHFKCEICDLKFDSLSNLENHKKSEHEEQMEVDEVSPNDEEQRKLSEMNDKKVLQKRKRQEEKDKLFEEQKKHEEKKKEDDKKSKVEEKKLESRKRKKQQKSLKISAVTDTSRKSQYPPNVSKIPQNIQHLVKRGSLQYLIPSDGSCGIKSGATHIFRDPKYGEDFRKLINNHMADRWDYYKNKVEFPYIRKVGVSGETVEFKVGEEQMFRDFLRSEKSTYLWTDSEDLQAMSNLYQMMIKIITTKGDNDTNSRVNWIGPDPELSAFKMLPEGIVPEMVLIHYEDVHYNLVIDADSDLAQFGALSNHVQSDEEKTSIMETENPAPENMDWTEDNSNEQKYEDLMNEYKKSQDTIEMLKNKIEFLEKKARTKPVVGKKSDIFDEELDEEFIIHSKNTGFRRESPQFQPKSKKLKPQFQCDQCNLMLESFGLLESHKQNHMVQSLKFTCVECDIGFSDSSLLDDHVKTTHGSKIEKQKLGKPRGVAPKESQYNCNDCSFQGYSKIELEQHLKTTHHGPSEANKITCHTCAKMFYSKSDLMKHRKVEHIDIIKKCRFFAAGGCEFEKEVCWFRHDNEVEQSRTRKTPDLDNLFKCRFCEKTFQEKSAFMLHRKNDHQRVVKQCRNYNEEGCSFTNEQCWYKHSENRHEKSLSETEEEHASGFWKAPMNTPPDDLMPRIISMMENILKEVELLKKESLKGQ